MKMTFLEQSVRIKFT